MFNQKSSGDSDQSALKFLSQNPAISRLLFADCGNDISRVATIIEPVLNASKRCEISAYYVQAIAMGHSAFLTTNLPEASQTIVTEFSTNWLVGRSRTCAISIPNTSISRCHAVISYCPERGFNIMDVGSSNGTFVNRRRLQSQVPCQLYDGDLIELSHTCIEFFLSGWQAAIRSVEETAV